MHGQLAAVRPERRPERNERGRHIGGVRGGTEVVREDCVLAVLALACMAAVAPVETARILEPPVPAARRLEQVAADRAHVAELRGRSEPARLAQRTGDVRIVLELGKRRARADAVAVHAARHDSADVDEAFGLQDPVPQERHHLGPSRK